MLPEKSSFNDLEVAYQMILVAIQPQTNRTQILSEISPFNDLEDQKLSWIIADSITPKEAMLLENYPFNEFEAKNRMLVASHPETPQITRT